MEEVFRMAINIKNDRVSDLASELAGLMGTSITEAVGEAIQEKLDRLRKSRERDGVAEKLTALGQKCAQRAPEWWLTHDYDAELYDDQGLPR